MSFSLFGNPLGKALLEAVARAKTSGKPSGSIAARVPPRLGKYLSAHGLMLEAVAEPRTDAGAGSHAIIVLVDTDDDEATLRAYRTQLVDGGLLIVASRHEANECSRRLLCAGYTMPEQLEVGRRVVTIGRSTDWG